MGHIKKDEEASQVHSIHSWEILKKKKKTKHSTSQVADRYNESIYEHAGLYGYKKSMRPESEVRNNDSVSTNDRTPAIISAI